MAERLLMPLASEWFASSNKSFRLRLLGSSSYLTGRIGIFVETVSYSWCHYHRALNTTKSCRKMAIHWPIESEITAATEESIPVRLKIQPQSPHW